MNATSKGPYDSSDVGQSCLSFNGGVYDLLNRVVSIIQTYCKQDNRRFDGKLRSIDNKDDE